jgi:hydroxymethylpyrimidine/phosphomethylpyrimidine kinase
MEESNTMSRSVEIALTIAGSDSGGGAGIQADLKTFAAFRVYGTSVITAVTAQNTLGVQGIYSLPPEFVAQQLDSVLSDLRPQAVKTGMLANREIIQVVAAKLKGYQIENLVVDPVMVAKSGDLLLTEDAQSEIKGELLRLVLLITPNLYEASILSGLEVKDLEEMRRAAQVIYNLGVPWVLIKGGHLEGDEATDLLYDGEKFEVFRTPIIKTPNTHGTGCTYSAAIAASLAKGLEVREAVRRAKDYITRAIEGAFSLGQGHGPLNHWVKPI